MVREIAIISDVAGSDPLKAGAWVLGVGTDDGGEDELDGVEVGLHEGQAGEGGGEESHGEEASLSLRRLYIFVTGTLRTLIIFLFRSERRPPRQLPRPPQTLSVKQRTQQPP